MAQKQTIDAMWDDSPIDVSTEVNFIWSIANKLRGTYQSDKYKDVIIPMVIIRRFECALEPTKDKVVAQFKANPNYPAKAMYRISGFQFYNTSEFTLAELINDADNLAANFKAYLQSFSPNVQEIIVSAEKGLDFYKQIDKMDKNDRLLSVVKAFSELDLNPRTIDNVKMGYIFEDLIRRFSENAEAGDHYTGRDIIKLMVNILLAEAKYERLVAVLKKKKNIILQGAPGVGKTFAAKRLAYSIMGEKDDDRIEFVQFHQNYSYEDFMMGYKPVEDGFELKYGIFYRFCQKAANHPDKDYFFIIDEINRGNMSKIFGELLMLIEADYRDTKATLAYNGLSFSVPKRLHIIGMMNTADRSLAMIDYALRRRFSFFDMEPGFDSEGFIKYQEGFANDTFNTLIDRIKELNQEIAKDKSLGKGFCIGHSYFCNTDECTEEWMQDVVDFDVLPMLAEYWFDDTDKLQRWENILHGVFQ